MCVGVEREIDCGSTGVRIRTSSQKSPRRFRRSLSPSLRVRVAGRPVGLRASKSACCAPLLQSSSSCSVALPLSLPCALRLLFACSPLFTHTPRLQPPCSPRSSNLLALAPRLPSSASWVPPRPWFLLVCSSAAAAALHHPTTVVHARVFLAVLLGLPLVGVRGDVGVSACPRDHGCSCDWFG